MPADVSVECEELIKRMLTIEPVRRITISEIVCHRWMTMAGVDPEFDKMMHESMRTLSPEPLEPLNELVLRHMDRLEIDRKETLRVRRDHFILNLEELVLVVVEKMKKGRNSSLSYKSCMRWERFVSYALQIVPFPVTLSVIHPLEVFSYARFYTFIQQLTRFQLS